MIYYNSRSREKIMTSADGDMSEASVEFYAGHRGGERPRAVVIAGRRSRVQAVLGRERVEDAATRARREIWRCRLDDGRTVTVEVLENGAARVSGPD
jgi:hypothetical protein